VATLRVGLNTQGKFYTEVNPAASPVVPVTMADVIRSLQVLAGLRN
jgi:hypothetical protein